MKHATFTDFVREAFYHGLDLVVITHKVNENAKDVMPQIHELLSERKLDEAEALLTKNYSRLVLNGVCTYWPTELERRDAADRWRRGGTS